MSQLVSDLDEKRIKQAYNQFKKKVPEIAEAYGVSESSIRRILKN